jgi:hypothetical protein
VQSTPWIPDALQACVLTPVERRRQPFDVGNGRLSGFVCYKALKSDRLGHIISRRKALNGTPTIDVKPPMNDA